MRIKRIGGNILLIKFFTLKFSEDIEGFDDEEPREK